MNKDILVSFIVPVYNCEKYIKDCVESICKLYNDRGNIECILVDDGSIDNSGLICDKLGKEHEFITVIHQKNQGVSAARNKGLLVSKGTFVTFVDGDDIVDYVDLSILEENNEYDIFSFGMQRMQTQEKNKKKIRPIYFFDKGIIYNLIHYQVYMNSVCNKFFRRRVIEQYNIKFDTNQVATEDLLFLISFFVHSEKIKYVKNKYYNYRYNQFSSTHSDFNESKLLNNISAYQKIKKFLEDNSQRKKYTKYLKFLRIHTAIPYLSDVNCYNPREFRNHTERTDIWNFNYRIDLYIITWAAQHNLFFLNNMYIVLKKIVTK